MSILNFLMNGLQRVNSLAKLKWFTRKTSKPSTNTMQEEEPKKKQKNWNQMTVPEQVEFYYRLKLLGKPFSEIDTKGKVWRGYEYQGIKYYER